MTDNILEVSDLHLDVVTRRGRANIVDGIDFFVRKGESLGVVGESGCGKSLTMLSLVQLLPDAVKVARGTAYFNGSDLLRMKQKELRDVRGGKIGFVFQDPMTSLNPVMRIGHQICEPLIYHRKMDKAAAWRRSEELLRLVGIPGADQRLSAYPHELSGGMRQRVMIAIGLACDPSLLVADEPTTSLDVTIQAQIVELIKDLRERLGMSVVWITHDLALVAGLADRILVIYAGTVVEEAPVDVLFEKSSHPYTKGLLSSIPRLRRLDVERLHSIAGTPPVPGRRPAGCPFRSRCPIAKPVCGIVRPRLLPVPRSEAGHRAACHVVNEEVVAA